MNMLIPLLVSAFALQAAPQGYRLTQMRITQKLNDDIRITIQPGIGSPIISQDHSGELSLITLYRFTTDGVRNRHKIKSPIPEWNQLCDGYVFILERMSHQAQNEVYKKLASEALAKVSCAPTTYHQLSQHLEPILKRFYSTVTESPRSAQVHPVLKEIVADRDYQLPPRHWSRLAVPLTWNLKSIEIVGERRERRKIDPL